MQTPSEAARAPRSQSWLGITRREALALFTVGLAVRALAAFALGTVGAVERESLWTWGHEAASIANALHEGRGFADPFGHGTGATGWLPPVFPLLLAGLLRLGGGLTATTALLFVAMQAVFSAATSPLIAGVGAACGSLRAGRVAAWIFVLYPAAIWTTVGVVWDTTLTAFFTTLLVLVLLRHGRAVGAGRALAIGALVGLGMLVSASLVVLVPIALVWSLGGPRTLRRIGANTAAIAAGVVLVTSPWLARNAAALGAPTQRTNLGVELDAGNNDLADGRMQIALHPSQGAPQARRYREVGELAYCREAGDRARAWIAAHPGRFAMLCLRRVQLWWIGEDPLGDERAVGATRARDDWRSWVRWAQHSSFGLLALGGGLLFARRRAQGRVLLALTLLFPLPYYVTHFYERYRFPIEPVLVLLATTLALEAYDSARERLSARSRARRALAPAASAASARGH